MNVIGGQFTRVSFPKYDMNSPAQLKDFLYTLDWVPDEWNYSNGERTSPKITLSSLESIGESQLGQWIKWYLTLKHRRNFIDSIEDPGDRGLVSLVRERDGRIPADGFTCGTPTARYRHFGIVNVPKCDGKVLYGCELRSLFHCIDPYRLVGSDLSAIEARLLGHFTSFFDGGEMAKELLEGDIHSKNAVLIGKDRNTAKTFFYALLYGAGVGKMASILECNNRRATIIMEAFFDGNPGLKALREHLKKKYKRDKYIIGIDGRALYIRSAHILLNSLIQGGAAIIFKKWGTLIWREIDALGLDAEIIISYHDEYQIRCNKNDLERLKKVLVYTLEETKIFYNLRVDLATDTAVGFNWADTH